MHLQAVSDETSKASIVDALRMSEDVSLETHRVDLELREPEL